MPLVRAIHAGLKTAAESGVLSGYLASFDFGAGSAPAVFTSREIPAQVERPAIILDITFAGEMDDYASKGVEQIIDVNIYGDKTQSSKTLRDIAQIVYEFLHRRDLVLESGYTHTGLWATPPVRLDDEDGYPGYLVECRGLFVVD